MQTALAGGGKGRKPLNTRMISNRIRIDAGASLSL
jgi:hypothetical protein